MICEEFSAKSKSNCLKDKKSHRVNTDDHDYCSTDAEKDDQSKETTVIQLQEKKQDLTKSQEHTYKSTVQEV